MSRIALALAVCLLAAPALAQTADSPTVTVKAKKPTPVCRTSSVSGSLMPTRTCHTPEEWAQIDAGQVQDLQNTGQRIGTLNHMNSGH